MNGYWLVYLGNGHFTHAVERKGAKRTVCGRSTAPVREWITPGSEPGCELCYRRVTR